MRLIKDTLRGITLPDKKTAAAAKKRLDILTKPKDSLGRLEEFSRRVAGITGNLRPRLSRKTIFTIAADHGVAREGVSLFPQDVTAQMIRNFLNGGAAINVLARHVGADVVIVDMGSAVRIRTRRKNFIEQRMASGTNNIARGPAMNRDTAIQAIETGISVFEGEFSKKRIAIAGLGEMGIGNTTAASAITGCITGTRIKDVTGRGTGISGRQLENKVGVIKTALRINMPDRYDPIDVLAKIGGFEIGGLTGVILAAAKNRVPVVIDGFITASAALIATEISPLSKEYLFASHDSVEKGHRIALRWMGLEPVLNLKMRLGEGTGACLGISMIEAGIKILNEMATFKDAGVSGETNASS
ncbi:MAG: nicotinate-nucleotide--dimethylbenzimidazole phosphoribosyltransferase [Candidatus Omnitrophota bacterium]